MNVSVQVPTESQSEGSLWLVTFADLTAILVAFFVLIYAMSAPLSGRGDARVVGGPGLSAVDQVAHQRDAHNIQTSSLPTLTVDYLAAVFSDRGLVARGDGGPLSQQVEHGRLVIRFAPEFAFASDGRALRPLAGGVVADLSRTLSGVANPISIMSSVPADDWALAFDRADSVAAALRQAGYSRPIERFVTPGLSGDALLLIISDQRRGGA